MPSNPAFYCRGPWIRDEFARIRIFRGVNVSGRSKSPPFLPFDEPKWFDQLKHWGFNVIRLLVLWEGLEPERGEIDQGYIDRVVGLVREAGARGLWVIIDFHQDLFARELGGDGAPSWAVKHHGVPAKGAGWFLHYARSKAVKSSLAAFWRDVDGIRGRFLECTRRVMTSLADEPAVLGYDLYNEPMAGLIDVLGGRFERGPLAEFYRACIQLRDAWSPRSLLFIEPTPLVAFGLPTSLPDLTGENLVYAPHLYDAPAILASRYLPAVSSFPRSVRRVHATAQRRAWPLFIGEFGIFGDISGSPEMLRAQCQLLDEGFTSWTAWHFNPTDVDWNDENGSLVLPSGAARPWTPALVRPYPRALAGEPIRWRTTRRGAWCLSYRAVGSSPTEIVVPAALLPGQSGGVDRPSALPAIRVTGGKWDVDPTDPVIYVHAHAEEVSVEIDR